MAERRVVARARRIQDDVTVQSGGTGRRGIDDSLVKEIEAGLVAPITVKSLGSFSDLDAEIKNRYAAEPANVPAWVPQLYWRAMLNGTGRLGPLMNGATRTFGRLVYASTCRVWRSNAHVRVKRLSAR